MTHLRIALFAGPLAAVLTVCPGIISQAFATFYDGNRLQSLCTEEGQIGLTMCMGYISGVSDTIDSSKNNLFGYKVCQPQRVSVGQIKDISVVWLKQNPQFRHFPATVLVIAALAEAFPCKN